MEFEDATIPWSRYEDLLEQEMFLEALNSAGVDNWDGISYAYEILEGLKVEKKLKDATTS
jgi:hypothetical protein